MTGYGRSTAVKKSTQVTLRIRSVNSRFLDLKVRGIELDPELDMKIRETVTHKLKRGSIHLHIDAGNSSNNESLVFNRSRFETIEKSLLHIQKEYGRHIDMSDIISLKDIFTENNAGTMDTSIVLTALDKALKQTQEMRVKEGEKLQKDMMERCAVLEDILHKLEIGMRDSAHERKVSYSEKLQELIGATQLDENRLMQELAILAERADVTEEIVRSRSHIEQFQSFLHSEEPVGKRLNFLLQEMSREVNTIGSKNANSNITGFVIELKSEVEKLREQVQNVL